MHSPQARPVQRPPCLRGPRGCRWFHLGRLALRLSASACEGATRGAPGSHPASPASPPEENFRPPTLRGQPHSSAWQYVHLRINYPDRTWDAGPVPKHGCGPAPSQQPGLRVGTRGTLIQNREHVQKRGAASLAESRDVCPPQEAEKRKMNRGPGSQRRVTRTQPFFLRPDPEDCPGGRCSPRRC